MFATFLFLILVRTQVAPKYRLAIVMSTLVVAIAGYHYLRIFESWNAAFVIDAVSGKYVPSGTPFNDAYRYIDWMLTVPLLVAELVAVLALTKGGGWLTARLATAALLMVALGYPGEIATDMGTRALWGAISTVPFLYIVYVLFTELGSAMNRQTEEVRVLLRNIRLLLLATWGFYPIVYLLPMLGVERSSALIAIQLGYCIADVAAKCGYGLMIYAIARAKSKADDPQFEARLVTAPAVGD
jgi:bacteriorhodopsin